MTTANQADQASSIPKSRKVLCVVYGAIAVAALIATWSQMGPYLHSPADYFTFWRDVKSIPAARVFTADLLLFTLAATILMVIEARKHNVRFVWAYIVGGLLVAISAAFPLFLIAREFRMGGSETSRLPTVDTILLAMIAVAVAGLTIWVDMG